MKVDNIERTSNDTDKDNDTNIEHTSDTTNDNNKDNDTKSLAGKKRAFGEINALPFCKERLLDVMKSLATIDDPSNTACYEYEFITAETQYELMEAIFPDLKQHCSMERLQYWVGQSNIWGPRQRKTVNGHTKYGRQLWIVRKEMRQFLAESSNSISSYWDHLRNETDYITIGYARKSPTKETDESRTRLLQLMVDKLFLRKVSRSIRGSDLQADQPLEGYYYLHHFQNDLFQIVEFI